MENLERNINEERDFIEEITTMFETLRMEHNFEVELNEYHPYDIKEALLLVSPILQKEVITRLSVEFAAKIFEHFEENEAIELIKLLPIDLAVKIIDHMESDDALDLLQYIFDEEEDIDIYELLSPKKRALLQKLWTYTDDQIGSQMSDSFIKIHPLMTVKEAMKIVTTLAAQTSYISIIYVVESQKLVGYIKLKQLIVARATEVIQDIMEERFIIAYPTDAKEDVASKMQQYKDSSIPIVDEDNHLLGIVTHDDIFDIISESKSEDYEKFVALLPTDIDLRYNTVGSSVKQRLPWLTILLILSMATSIILSFFEEKLSGSIGAKILAANLAIYLPLILDMSGNTGTQSLAVMIRYLTTNKNEISSKTIRKHLLREIGTGFIQGFVLGALVFLMIFVSHYITTGIFFEPKSFITALVTSLSICIALFVSTVLGALIPLFIQKMKYDPAVASGPFITTISDIITLSLYYTISLAILLPLYL